MRLARSRARKICVIALAVAILTEHAVVWSALCAYIEQGAMSTNHTSSDGTFKIELNDGSTWMLYSSNTDIEFYYAPAEPNQPNA